MRPLITALLIAAGLMTLFWSKPAVRRQSSGDNKCLSTAYGLKCGAPVDGPSPGAANVPGAISAEVAAPSPAPRPSPAPPPSKWDVNSSTSPVDDSKTVVLSLNAENMIPVRLRNTYLPTLVLRCEEKKTQAYVVLGTYLGLERTPVTYRLDKNQAVTRDWGISTDHEAVFFRGSHVAFMKELMKHDELFIRLAPYGASPVSTSFDLRGLKEAIKPLQEACKWK